MTAITNANLPVSNGSGDAALAHVQSNRVIGSTTIATDTIANWPANFIATTGTLLSSGFIDPTSKTDFYGHLGVGNQLIIDGFCPGNADNGNTSGQVVVIKPNTEWANLIAQGVQGTSLFPFQFANFVEPAGGIWTTSSGLVGTQTSGNVWYQGIRYSIPAVATFTFAVSKDTYVDVNPATSAYTYVPVANNAQEPAVTASCVRVAKVVTGASAITNIYQHPYIAPVTGANTFRWTATGLMTGAITLTTSYQDVATVTLPATSAAHKYLVIGNFEFNQEGTTNGYDITSAIRDNSNNILAAAIRSTISGAANWLADIHATAVYTASAAGGDVVKFSAQQNTGSVIQSNGNAHYVILDLGLA